MIRIDLNDLWKKYCELIELPEEKMSPVQHFETKKAFYGALGQLLIIFHDMADGDPEEAVETLRDMVHQVEVFWAEAVIKWNKMRQ